MRGFETRRERDALDRHITGNYGEGFFREDPPENEVEPCLTCDAAKELAEVLEDFVKAVEWSPEGYAASFDSKSPTYQRARGLLARRREQP